jgi:hypothetical protein
LELSKKFRAEDVAQWESTAQHEPGPGSHPQQGKRNKCSTWQLNTASIRKSNIMKSFAISLNVIKQLGKI